jgi:hypothetical protein
MTLVLGPLVGTAAPGYPGLTVFNWFLIEGDQPFFFGNTFMVKPVQGSVKEPASDMDYVILRICVLVLAPGPDRGSGMLGQVDDPDAVSRF